MRYMEVVLGNEGIRSLKNFFRGMQTDLHNTMRKSEIEIAEYGRQQLEAFAPTSDIDGNRTGSISVERDADAIRVVYSGEDVAYIEFGTGYRGQANPYPDEIVLNNANWVYDVNEHGYGGWVYRKKDGSGFRHSRGMKPEAPVLKAYEKTKMAVPRIVKEVMNEELGS